MLSILPKLTQVLSGWLKSKRRKFASSVPILCCLSRTAALQDFRGIGSRDVDKTQQEKEPLPHPAHRPAP